MPPGQNMDDLLTIFKSGMWRLFYKLSNEGRKRFFNEFFPLLHDTKYLSLPLQILDLFPMTRVADSCFLIERQF
jgi:hypothetical protein